MRRLLLILCAFGLWPAIAAPAGAADTTLVRELAKNKARVLIVVSGPQTADIGKGIQSGIQRHPDFKRAPDDVTVVPMGEAETAAAPRAKQPAPSVIFVLARGEMKAPVPASLASLLPVRLDELKATVSVAQCALLRKPSDGLAFAAALVAPDKERVARLVPALMERSAARYDGLPFRREFTTNRIALFSTEEVRGAVEHWGELSRDDVWNDLRWRKLGDRAQLSPAELAECAEAYFIDRSRFTGELPAPASKLLTGERIGETTVLVKHGENELGSPIVVFTAPSRALLETRIAQYADFTRLPTSVDAAEAVDMRSVAHTTAAALGRGPAEGDAEQIQADLAGMLREQLGVSVDQRADVLGLLAKGTTTVDLSTSGDKARVLRGTGARYLWLFRISSYSGSTDYTSNMTCLTTDTPRTYEDAHRADDPEPQLVVNPGGDGSQEAYDREYAKWKQDHDAWLRRKTDWEDREQERFTTQWSRTVTSTATARVGGSLQLVDLKGPADSAQVLWEKACQGSATDGPRPYQSDTATVRGVGNRPSSLTAPPREPKCAPELLLSAARDAAKQAVASLKAQALFRDPNAPEPATEQSQNDVKPVEPGQPNGQKPDAPAQPSVQAEVYPVIFPDSMVAAVVGNTVILQVGPALRLKAGDKVEVGIRLRAVPSPTDPKVTLRWIALDSVVLKIADVSSTSAEGVPVDAAGAAKLSSLKPKMPIVRVLRPVPPAPKKPAAAGKPKPRK